MVHIRIRSREPPAEDPFAFLFPQPRKHPVILEAVNAAAQKGSRSDRRESIKSTSASKEKTPITFADQVQGSGRKRTHSHSEPEDDAIAGERRSEELQGKKRKIARTQSSTPVSLDDGNDDVPLRVEGDRKHQASPDSVLSQARSSKQDPGAGGRNASSDLLRRLHSKSPNPGSSPLLDSESSPLPGAHASSGPAALTIIHSADVVHNNMKKYMTWFAEAANSEGPIDAKPTVELVYSTKHYRETFSLLRPKALVARFAGSSHSGGTLVNLKDVSCEYDPVTDLIDTVRMLVAHTLVCPSQSIRDLFSDDAGALLRTVGTLAAIGTTVSNSGRTSVTPPPQGMGLLRRLERARNRRSFSDFVAAVNDFNREYARCKKEGFVMGYTKKRLNQATDEESREIRRRLNEFTPPDLVAHILYQSYARAVAPHAELLQKYEAFSNTVYGEINPVFADMFVDRLGIKSDHTFLDLGSGIGNVVLHVAARTECHAYGIEIQKGAATLAQAQLDEFRARIKYFNRRMGAVELYHGDMLHHSAIPGLVRKADIIFVNNYVFQPELNRALVELFLDVKEGARIVSLKAFAPVDNRVTSRNVHSVEALFDVQAFEYGADYVSWTDQSGRWFVHTMNRQRVASFLKDHHNRL